MKYRNNPFNIRSGSRWLGLAGSKNGFCEFENIEYGIRAAAVLLMQSYRKKGCVTLTSIVRRFAPPSENDTSRYIYYLSDSLGISPSSVLESRYQYILLLVYMARFESGTFLNKNYVSSVIKKFNIYLYCLTPKK